MKQASGAAIGTADVDATLIQVLDDLEDLGQPDGSTLENSSGTLRIKDLGVPAAKLAADSVTTAKILNANVTNAKLAANAVAGSGTGTNVVLAGSIGTADLANDAVTADKILDATIVNGNIANTNLPMQVISISITSFSHGTNRVTLFYFLPNFDVCVGLKVEIHTQNSPTMINDNRVAAVCITPF